MFVFCLYVIRVPTIVFKQIPIKLNISLFVYFDGHVAIRHINRSWVNLWRQNHLVYLNVVKLLAAPANFYLKG